MLHRMLQQQMKIEGSVMHGDGYGSTIGYPTANLDVDFTQVSIAPGIYAGRAFWDGHEQDAALIIDADRGRVEAHILDFEGDLYGRHLRVEPLQKIRDYQQFSSEADLIAQIGQDIAAIRHFLGYYVHRDH
ncbi:MAG: hypothetical protein COU35_01070 [Candidatus Magasanikbacteria bacterium CG10_big_fil_rev_8_21_14_0_10_47_10]|uniref:riboflavin kinase n=1 Tax=Candidatus Magasanikbacteria bacterium CG10_big_fil_rev_8_21_14_0_10_47_10 TaxID=1974652 RepID=A0A2H0TRE1_9BACT|nr:MAG: hypothetical protein COU35_01070 [Candidatus Magasanikbacteria bacterium CG10_big_fil_rev_8_21_14_0_10_47_10]